MPALTAGNETKAEKTGAEQNKRTGLGNGVVKLMNQDVPACRGNIYILIYVTATQGQNALAKGDIILVVAAAKECCIKIAQAAI